MSNDQQILLKRVTFIPDILGGRASIRSMRFLVSDILELLSSGLSEAEIIEQHPILEKEDIHAALLYASLKMKNTIIIHAA